MELRAVIGTTYKPRGAVLIDVTIYSTMPTGAHIHGRTYPSVESCPRNAKITRTCARRTSISQAAFDVSAMVLVVFNANPNSVARIMVATKNMYCWRICILYPNCSLIRYCPHHTCTCEYAPSRCTVRSRIAIVATRACRRCHQEVHWFHGSTRRC